METKIFLCTSFYFKTWQHGNGEPMIDSKHDKLQRGTKLFELDHFCLMPMVRSIFVRAYKLDFFTFYAV